MCKHNELIGRYTNIIVAYWSTVEKMCTCVWSSNNMQTIQAIIAFTLYAVIGYIAKVNAKTIVSVIDHLLRVARGQERES